MSHSNTGKYNSATSVSTQTESAQASVTCKLGAGDAMRVRRHSRHELEQRDRRSRGPPAVIAATISGFIITPQPVTLQAGKMEAEQTAAGRVRERLGRLRLCTSMRCIEIGYNQVHNAWATYLDRLHFFSDPAPTLFCNKGIWRLVLSHARKFSQKGIFGHGHQQRHEGLLPSEHSHSP